MPPRPMLLLTILTEAVLEERVTAALGKLGAKGYTISEARGSGTHGVRNGQWSEGANIRIEVVGEPELVGRIVEYLMTRYDRHYGLLMFTTQVELHN